MAQALVYQRREEVGQLLMSWPERKMVEATESEHPTPVCWGDTII